MGLDPHPDYPTYFQFHLVHEATGLTVKVRPNLLIDSPKGQRRTLVDFKTTRCRDLAQFLDTVEKYGYDRQAAAVLRAATDRPTSPDCLT
ncbi:hypothetical protein GKZ68_07055 [Hymenobacter sp. BRD128]|uniref:hypothetical protein n=1 Tax=Hymenobacter sp. BRD128 TaxID=2675878 RepID=UPI0015671193|nr:hypothetical protein [Hymenobacter sp. BRD128]QKG55162.1 hypothetical protein GKZ68_07055 [Hymenobacter sp. BRD128]